MAKKLEAVLFDWAGTTMDYGCYAPAVVFQKVFADKCVPITMQEARKPMGKHKKLHIAEIISDQEVGRRWFKVYGREPTSGDVENMFASFVPAQMPILVKYADLIPGTLDTIGKLRQMGLKIGSTTGYTGEMMKVLLCEAAEQGYVPDVSVCATGHYALGAGKIQELLSGLGDNASRPKPAMCNLNAYLLDVSNNAAVVKVGDTLDDIREGKNAGMWTIGLAGTGNEMYLAEEHEGMTEAEVKSMDQQGYLNKLLAAYDSMSAERPDFIIDSIKDVPEIIYRIDRRLAISKGPGEYPTLKCSNYLCIR